MAERHETLFLGSILRKINLYIIFRILNPKTVFLKTHDKVGLCTGFRKSKFCLVFLQPVLFFEILFRLKKPIVKFETGFKNYQYKDDKKTKML